MQKTYRPQLLLNHMSGRVETWMCEHHHKDKQAAALCGQLALRVMMPNTSTKKDSVRFEAFTSRVFIWDRERTSDYISLGRYHELFGTP